MRLFLVIYVQRRFLNKHLRLSLHVSNHFSHVSFIPSRDTSLVSKIYVSCIFHPGTSLSSVKDIRTHNLGGGYRNSSSLTQTHRFIGPRNATSPVAKPARMMYLSVSDSDSEPTPSPSPRSSLTHVHRCIGPHNTTRPMD
jgi:hypothetical protein